MCAVSLPTAWRSASAVSVNSSSSVQPSDLSLFLCSLPHLLPEDLLQQHSLRSHIYPNSMILCNSESSFQRDAETLWENKSWPRIQVVIHWICTRSWLYSNQTLQDVEDKGTISMCWLGIFFTKKIDDLSDGWLNLISKANKRGIGFSCAWISSQSFPSDSVWNVRLGYCYHGRLFNEE